MALWNYCAICGKRIEVGEPCLGIEKENTEIVGDSICFDCVKVENINGLEKTVSITDLLTRAEAAEKERDWLKMCFDLAQRKEREAEARSEKAERDRDAAVADLTFAVNEYRRVTTDIDLCGLCKFDLPPAGENGQTAECPGFYEDNCFKWRGQKEE